MLSPTVLKIPHCTDVIPPCTEYPPQYWRYPPLYWSYSPLYWTTSTVLKVSPTVLILFSTVLNNLHSTEGIPHSTQAISHIYCCYAPHSSEGTLPQYWRYPPKYWCIPQDWCYPLHVLRLSPTVLKLSHCTEQALQYWSYPPQYWCYPPNVLNNLQCTESLHSTELTLYGVEFEFATVNWICCSEYEFAVVNFNLPWQLWATVVRCDNKNNAKKQNVRRQTCTKVFACRVCVQDVTVLHGKSVEFNLIQRSILLMYCYIRTFPCLVSYFKPSNNAYVLAVQASSTIPINTVLMGEFGTLAPLLKQTPTLWGKRN